FSYLDLTVERNLDVGIQGGISTFRNNIDLNADLDVDGHTNLDNVSIAGVTTFAGAIDANSNLDVAGTATLGSGASGQATLQYQGATKLETQSWGVRATGTLQANNGNLQQFKSAANDTGSILLTNSTGNAFEIKHTSSNSSITGIVGNISINAPTVSISTNFSVACVSTFTGAIDANGDLDVDGHTNLD
ncbi:MAG: hypothetical protein VXY93_19950, partial [Pseudomonadota bacterium]|nr:hypothetical protein [Pseudomonadota bacterium]